MLRVVLIVVRLAVAGETVTLSEAFSADVAVSIRLMLSLPAVRSWMPVKV
jgi:hypothetical protein